MTFDIAMYYAQVVHILEYSSCIQGHFYPFPQIQINLVLFHMKQTEHTLSYMLKNNNYIWDLRHDTHKQTNVRVT